MNAEEFPILKKKIYGKQLVYLDNSATTQKPQCVIDSMKNFYENENANIHRGIHQLSVVSTIAYEDAHHKVADFIGAEFEEIIFTRGTTESLNLCATSLGKNLKQGDEIVISEMEHHSNIVAWQNLVKEKGVVLKYIPLTENYRLDMNKAKELIGKNTKIVSITHMSNVLGTINPIKEIVEIAHQNGAIMIVDAAQSIPHIPINVKELNCDFLAFSAHKMIGPTGVGVLYGKKELLEKMEPYQFGGDMISQVTFEKSTWNDLPWKFEAGTPAIAEAVGLAEAIKFLRRLGMQAIFNHCKSLTEYALKKLTEIEGLKIIGPGNAENRGPVLSFVMENIHPHDISEMLNKEGVAVRAGHHCAMPLHSKLNLPATTRASFYLYNKTQDIDILVQKLNEIKEVYFANKSEIFTGDLSEDQEIYKENILDHARFPHNKKELDEFTFKNSETNSLCGDEIILFVKINDNQISDISFMGNGCAISQASASLLTDHLKNMSIEEVKNLSQEDLQTLLGIPISHTRIKCAVLPLLTLQNGMEDSL